MPKYRVTVEGREYEVSVEEIPDEHSPHEVPQNHRSDSLSPKKASATGTQPAKSAGGSARGTEVKAPLAGSIISVSVNVGQRVQEGDLLLSLEALKLENEITAPVAGEVVEIVSEGETVETGQILARIV